MVDFIDIKIRKFFLKNNNITNLSLIMTAK